jgi:rare lipoprotein A
MNRSLIAALGLLFSLGCLLYPPVADGRSRSHHPAAAHPHRTGRHSVAHSSRARPSAVGGHVQTGVASVYSDRFRGRRMADGTQFLPGSDSAASKTLPLGTTAQVTNLQNGRTATVQIRDRGPHRAGRIIDLSPSSAGALGMPRRGTAPVAVAPVRQ